MNNCLMHLKVLIVDDDPFQIELLEGVIRECGHNVFSVSDPVLAPDFVRTHYLKLNPFDMAFIDYMMPGMDGLNLCRKLEAIDPTLGLILLTSDNSIETRKNILKFGHFSAAVNKAAGLDAIRRHLNMALSNKKEKMSGRKSLFLERKKEIRKL